MSRTLTFWDVDAAFGFMAGAALLAEKMNHHLKRFNVYDRPVLA